MMHNKELQRERVLSWKLQIKEEIEKIGTADLTNNTIYMKIDNKRLRVEIIKIWVYIVIEKIKKAKSIHFQMHEDIFKTDQVDKFFSFVFVNNSYEQFIQNSIIFITKRQRYK